MTKWATRYFAVVSIFSVTVNLFGRLKGQVTRKTEHGLCAQPQGQGFSFLGTRNDFLWQANILHTKELGTFSWQKILIENFSLARTYLWWCGVATVRTTPFSEVSIPVAGVAKGFTSVFGAWTACGKGNISHHLRCLSLRIFSGSTEGDATLPIQVFPSSYDCWMYAAVKLKFTNKHNRFCLWGAASAKAWLGLNTSVVIEFVWRSVSVPHSSPDITPSAPSILRHHTLMNKEQTYFCSKWTRNYTRKTLTRHFHLSLLWKSCLLWSVLSCIQPSPFMGWWSARPSVWAEAVIERPSQDNWKRSVLKNYWAFSSSTQALVYLF